ncbi:MAG: hypothetical protein FJ083_13160 [Cyanobacteria bacterium K_Offshore_surface_m2_239]|nr:hypothetical protein [Cyanobacteria bacterium K_Offshore_surface_m2_239]
MTTPAAYISYAWGDDASPEGREREAIVDDLCHSFAEEGIVIGRDKNEVKVGDSIEAFGHRIAQAQVILAVISHRSLRSKWCMIYELYEAFLRRGQSGKEFGNNVVALVLDDASEDLSEASMKPLLEHWDKWCKDLEEALQIAERRGRNKSPDSNQVLEKCKDMIACLPDMLLAIRRIAMPRGSAEIRRDDFQSIREYVKSKLQAGHADEPATSLSRGMGTLPINQSTATRQAAGIPAGQACDAVALFLTQSGGENHAQTSYEWKAFIRYHGQKMFGDIPNSTLRASASYVKKDLPKLLQCLRSWIATELTAEPLLDIYVPIELLDEDWGSFYVEGGKSKKTMRAYQPYMLRSTDRVLKRELNFRQAALRHMHVHLHDGTGTWLPSEDSGSRDVIANLSGEAIAEEEVVSAICFLQSDISKAAKSRAAWIKTMLNSALDSMAPLVVWPTRKCSLDDSQVHLCLNRLAISKPQICEGKELQRPHCPDQARLAEIRRRWPHKDMDIRGLQILVDHPDRALDRAMLQALFSPPRQDTPAAAEDLQPARQPAPQLSLIISPLS